MVPGATPSCLASCRTLKANQPLASSNSPAAARTVSAETTFGRPAPRALFLTFPSVCGRCPASALPEETGIRRQVIVIVDHRSIMLLHRPTQALGRQPT